MTDFNDDVFGVFLMTYLSVAAEGFEIITLFEVTSGLSQLFFKSAFA